MGRWSTDAGSFSWQRVLFGARPAAFGFELLSPEGFEAGGKYPLKRGSR
jgi:hypothetical protein